MTDAAYCLHETERERKSLARMSRYKKNGSRTNYVQLRQNNMTQKEWKKMNEKVYTITLSKPMSKGEFKSLTDDLKKMYLRNLADNYEARRIDAGRMLGYSQNGFWTLCERLFKGEQINWRSGYHPSQKWKEFIGANEPNQSDSAVDFVESAPVVAEKEELLEKIDAPTHEPLSLENLRVRYVGTLPEAFTKVFDLVGGKDEYVINIELFPANESRTCLPF